jgi:NAD+ diphosphatase
VITTFAGARLDRAGEHRADPAWVARQEADPAARAVVVTASGIVVDAQDPTRLARFPPAEVGRADPRVLLGIEDGGPLFAVGVDAIEGGRDAGLRDAATTLRQDEGGLAAYAAAIVGWHRLHPFCARCGAQSDPAEAGHVRVCRACAAIHHPRTDPVVIMLVTDGERLLLGRQPTWDPGRYSTLAGFVEPGESLEEAVAREVREETGVEVTSPRYVGSQPWPFPASLMLGFTADYAGGEVSARDTELADVRWFTRAEVEDAAAGRGPIDLPPREAIARRLIDTWLEGPGG